MSGTWWLPQDRLDSEQSKAVMGLGEAESFLLRGAAGSGKTNILLLRAKWLRAKGKSYLRVIVFTRTLRDFLREGCDRYMIPPEDVQTSTQFFKGLLAEYGIVHEPSGTFEEDRIILAGKVKSLLESKRIENIFDALLVDEAQDYSDTELGIFRALAPRLIIAMDSRQSIYRTTGSAGFSTSLVGGTVIELKRHYRTGVRICRIADGILKDSANFASIHGESEYDEAARPSSLTTIQCVDFTEQVRRILEKLPGQLDLYPGELIGVLFPKREQLQIFTAELESSHLPDAERVVADTMHGAKGLEFRAVHLGGAEALPRMGPTQKRLIYTSILRGRTAVSIYHSAPLPGYVASAIARVSAPPPEPTLEDLLGS